MNLTSFLFKSILLLENDPVIKPITEGFAKIKAILYVVVAGLASLATLAFLLRLFLKVISIKNASSNKARFKEAWDGILDESKLFLGVCASAIIISIVGASVIAIISAISKT